jgi:ribosomal protein S18 acetylase RimI-like enzyme
MILVPQTPEHVQQALAFMAARGVEIFPSNDLRLIAHANAAGEMDAVVAYNGFNYRICSMHVAGDGGRWIDRQMLRVCFDYVFRQCDRVAVYGQVASNNMPALRLDTHLGFKEVHRIKDAVADGVDLVILEMRRENCRWLKDRRIYGKQVESCAA